MKTRLITLRHPQGNHRSGQILPLFLFLFLMTLGVMGVMYKIGALAEKRIVLQRSADSAAIAGARVQALGLGGVAILNDAISAEFAKLMADIADPEGWPSVPCDIKRIENTKTAQDAITYTVPVAAEVAAITMSQTNGAEYGFALPSGNGSSLGLNLTRPIYFLTLFMVRKGSDVTEQITVMTANASFSDVMSDQLASSTNNLLGTKHKMMAAYGSSKPYYVFANNPVDPSPRDADMNLLWQDLSMFVPGPFWNTRLVETPQHSPASGIAGKLATGFGLAKSQGIKKAYAEVKKQLLEDVGQEETCE